MSKRPLLRVKSKEGRRVRAGAPWIFSNEIVMTPEAKELPPGALVQVEGERGERFGAGYFNPKSLIAVRLLSADPDADFGTAFFADRIRRALALRTAFYDRPFYRLVHAEGDGLPGLVIDRFGDCLVLQMTTAGMDALRAPVCDALEAGLAPQTILLRNDAPARVLEGLGREVLAVKGDMPSRLSVEENGIRYFADLQEGQKTGWYYDQRPHRAFVASVARGKTMLDLYCYSGGFSVLAAVKGARDVIGIDSSQPALLRAQEAATANGVEKSCKFVKADVMEQLERLAQRGEKFDLVVADPPPFVRARKDLESGARAYRKLARLAASVTAPNGFLLLASCSHNIPAERFALECAAGLRRAGRDAALLHQSGAGPDHPVHPALPETAYLKVLIYALD